MLSLQTCVSILLLEGRTPIRRRHISRYRDKLSFKSKRTPKDNANPKVKNFALKFENIEGNPTFSSFPLWWLRCAYQKFLMSGNIVPLEIIYLEKVYRSRLRTSRKRVKKKPLKTIKWPFFQRWRLSVGRWNLLMFDNIRLDNF